MKGPMAEAAVDQVFIEIGTLNSGVEFDLDSSRWNGGNCKVHLLLCCAYEDYVYPALPLHDPLPRTPSLFKTDSSEEKTFVDLWRSQSRKFKDRLIDASWILNLLPVKVTILNDREDLITAAEKLALEKIGKLEMNLSVQVETFTTQVAVSTSIDDLLLHRLDEITAAAQAQEGRDLRFRRWF